MQEKIYDQDLSQSILTFLSSLLTEIHKRNIHQNTNNTISEICNALSEFIQFQSFAQPLTQKSTIKQNLDPYKKLLEPMEEMIFFIAQ